LSIWVARIVFDFDHYLVGVDPLQIAFEDSRFGVGQADDSVGISSASSGPFLTAGVLEELGFRANEVLVDGESDLVWANERSDEVVILVTTATLSVGVGNPHFGLTNEMRLFELLRTWSSSSSRSRLTVGVAAFAEELGRADISADKRGCMVCARSGTSAGE
jgi:hypothetical protein